MTNLSFQQATSEADFYESATNDLVFSIKETLKDFEDCRIGLAGGSTPEKLYTLFAKEDLPWEKIKIIIIDERYVSSDDPESNLRMIRRNLLNHIPIPPENIISFDTSLPAKSAAKEMSRKLIGLSHDRFPIFDLLVLGAGSDGHIASIFEGSEALTCPNYACESFAKGYPTPKRLTLTLISLLNSTRALLLLKGESKKAVLSSLQGDTDTPKLTALKAIHEKMPLKVLYYF